MSHPRPAVFLDRDGVLNVDHGYVHRPEQVEWVPGAIASVKRLNDLGYRVVVVTNQAGVAHGHYSEDSVFALHAWMRDELAAQGAVVDAFYHCPYHPEGRVEQFRKSHIDRKPGPGMILRAFSDLAIEKGGSFLIGDKESDIAAARAAGIPGFLFGGGDLLAFVERCLAERGRAAPSGGADHQATKHDFPLLRQALPPVLAWMRNDALPFWGSAGVDRVRGGFHERLDLEGRPLEHVPKRLMVQARQLYVYCHAGLLGWHPDARPLADRTVDYMIASFYRPDGKAGFVHALAPDGGIADPTRDLYGHAFALFGLAWYHRLTGDAEVLKIADATLAYLDEELISDHGGYLDAWPRRDAIRRQNPHMHLFEALIALHQATGNPKHLARAAELVGLFSTRFFAPASGTLTEYLTEDLRPLPDPRGRVTEPGHHYEWVWLLRAFGNTSARNVATYCDALYDHADRYGWDRQGFVVDELDIAGAVLKSSRRSWPQTECVKANIVEGERGRVGCDEKAARSLARLADTFVARPVRGGFIDHVDQAGAPLVAMMPASTLYHVFGAVAEAARVL